MYEFIEEHYRNNKNRLLKKFSRSTGTTQDGEDIVQEGYYRAMKYFHSFGAEKDLDVWINTIMYNVFRDFMSEKNKVPRKVSPANLPSIPDSIMVDDLMRFVEKYSKNLKESHKKIIKLHCKYGYTLKEIGQIVDLSMSNIKIILYRFRLCAREMLG